MATQPPPLQRPTSPQNWEASDGDDDVLARAAAGQAAERRVAGLGEASSAGAAAAGSSAAAAEAGSSSTAAHDDDDDPPIPAADKGKGRQLDAEEYDRPAVEQVPPPPPLLPARKPILTVDDLEHKSCWICMDDDLPDTRFVHPCNCTLIAHEACLLTWIASQQQTKGDRDPVCCPQCKAEFLIDENLGGLLKLLNRGDRFVGKVSSLLLLSTLGSSVLSTSALVGFSSLRLFFGADVARITLTGVAHGPMSMGAWRWWAWVGLPLVPVGLIANSLTTSFLAEARVKVLESLLLLTPFFLLPRPTLHHPATPRGPWLLSRSVVGELWSVRWGAWPPGPGAVIVLLGIGEVAYLALKREVERFVLGSTSTRRSLFSWLFPRRAPAPPPAAERRFLATPGADGNVRFRVFEPDQPAGQGGADVQTDEVALALALARRDGRRVQVLVWEDEQDGTRPRRDVIEAPINWDDFDAAGQGAFEGPDDDDGDGSAVNEAYEPASDSTPDYGAALLASDMTVPDDGSSEGGSGGGGVPSWYDEDEEDAEYDDDDGHWDDDDEFAEDETDDDDDEPDTDDELAAIELAIAAGPAPENGPVREGELPLEALFLSRLSLTRIAASALAMPALSALAGRALLWLAQRYSPTLANFLGVAGGRRRTGFGAAGFMGAAWWGAAGFASGGGAALDDLDPVWWRNAVGAAVIVVVRDSCSLLHKYLKLQGRRTRKIVERSFEGLDMQ